MAEKKKSKKWIFIVLIAVIAIILLILLAPGCETSEEVQEPIMEQGCQSNDDCPPEKICDSQTNQCTIQSINLLE